MLGAIVMMLDELEAEPAFGVAGTQLFVPVLREEPFALTEAFGLRAGLGVALGVGTVGTRTMFVPLKLRPKEDEPRLRFEPFEMGIRVTLDEPREAEEPIEIPLEEEEPEELIRGVELLGLEGMILEPIEGEIILELIPLELLPLELLPLELLL